MTTTTMVLVRNRVVQGQLAHVHVGEPHSATDTLALGRMVLNRVGSMSVVQALPSHLLPGKVEPMGMVGKP